MRRAFRRQLCLLPLLLALCGCGMLGAGVETSAARYYNFMVGRKTDVSYTAFFSPAYRKQISAEDRKRIDEAMRTASRPSERYPETAADEVLTAREGRFAYTSVDPAKGDAYREIGAVKWVRVGMRWYVYMNSDAEHKAYGPFPHTLTPPRPELVDPDEAQ